MVLSGIWWSGIPQVKEGAFLVARLSESHCEYSGLKDIQPFYFCA
jgi:hypothetical protein